MKHPSGSSNKSVTSQKGGVISDMYLLNKQKCGQMLIGFLPNKESVI